MSNIRFDRDQELDQARDTRDNSWSPPNLLPDPKPDDEYVYRYIRKSALGQEDPANMSVRSREGWVPVRAEDHPEVALSADKRDVNATNIEIGGLILCKMPRDRAAARKRYYEKLAEDNIRAVNNNVMRESNPRMPMNKPEHTTRVTFGGGSKPEKS